MKWDRDAELAKKLQAEEEARAAAAGSSMHGKEAIEKRRREQEDERLAREMQENDQRLQRKASLETAEADARLARQMQEEEEKADRERREQQQRQDEEAARVAREAQLSERHSVAQSDEELARSLQLEEAAASSHDEDARDGNSSDSDPRLVPIPRRGQRVPNSDENGQDGVVLISDSDEDVSMDEVHRRHAAANRRNQLANSAALLEQQHRGDNPHTDSQQQQRSREAIIRRLHNLQGTYPGVGPNRNATFRFAPDGRLIMQLEPDSDEDDGAASLPYAQRASEPNSDAALADASPIVEDPAAQRAALEHYARQHQERKEQEESGGGGGAAGMIGSLLGHMLTRYVHGRARGIPFPLSMMIAPPQSSSSSSQPSSMAWFSRGGVRPAAAEIDVDHMDYQQLLDLEEALGSVKPKVTAARASEIDQLPVQEYHRPKPVAAAASSSSSSSSSSKPAAVAAEEQQCSVCLSEFEEGDALKTLPCFHRYHASCIDQWLRQNKVCPVCRVPIV